jgi:UDP-glucose 4-epimerase
MFENKIFLITGGTGSFGNAVVKKLLETNAKEIRIFSRDEKKQHDMRKANNNTRLKFFIGDVRDYNSIKDAIYDVDYVFHAAAFKQVPSCEFFPLEAVKTNVLGTENVLNASIEYGVEKVICLSTDKAVYPVNAMGTSKAMMEKVFVAKSRTVRNGKTVICGTRYGNVLASRGSVIPLFVSQIRNNQNLTITEPTMTRFIMSLEEAVDLVFYAFENGEQGDIFVQKSPACTINTLAQAVCEIFKYPIEKIDIIGIRHGEKMYESLLSKEEASVAEDLGNYYRVPSDKRDLNYDQYFVEGKPNKSKRDEYNSNNTTQLNVEQVVTKLSDLDYIKSELSNGK